jgi:hypothetical protein
VCVIVLKERKGGGQGDALCPLKMKHPEARAW